MKVALVLEKFDLQRGGAERSSFEMGRALGELGCEVTLLAGRVNRAGVQEVPFEMVEVPVRGALRTTWWRHFQQAMEAHFKTANYDIVHSMVPLATADVYQPRGGSILHSSMRHGQSFGPVKNAYKQLTRRFNRGRECRIASERQLCRGSDGPVVAALSGYVAEQFRHDYGLAENRIRLIRNGIQTGRFTSEQAKENGRKLRRLYDSADNLAIFVFAAASFRLKGLGWLIRSAARAAAQLGDGLRDFRVLVVGGEDYSAYYQQAQALKLEQKVIFTGPTQEMPAMLQMADAVILPTYNDACSRLIMEGLAAGRPGITTRFNGAADFLTDRESDAYARYGSIVKDCDDDEALAIAMLRVCHRAEWRKMCQAIQADHLAEQVSMTRHARELFELYETLKAAK